MRNSSEGLCYLAQYYAPTAAVPKSSSHPTIYNGNSSGAIQDTISPKGGRKKTTRANVKCRSAVSSNHCYAGTPMQVSICR